MGSKLDRIMDWDAVIEQACYRSDRLKKIVQSSDRNLRRKFVTYFGKPTQYVLDERRTEKAKAMLLQGMAEKVIADLLGFKRISHFSTFFKRRTNETPRRFVDRVRSATR
jgi:AraC-like DNA-binding protein